MIPDASRALIACGYPDACGYQKSTRVSQGIGPIVVCLNRLTLRGFIVWDYKEQWGDFIEEVGPCCGTQQNVFPVTAAVSL